MGVAVVDARTLRAGLALAGCPPVLARIRIIIVGTLRGLQVIRDSGVARKAQSQCATSLGQALGVVGGDKVYAETERLQDLRTIRKNERINENKLKNN